MALEELRSPMADMGIDDILPVHLRMSGTTLGFSGESRKSHISFSPIELTDSNVNALKHGPEVGLAPSLSRSTTLTLSAWDKRDMQRLGRKQSMRRNFRMLSMLSFTVVVQCTYEFILV